MGGNPPLETILSSARVRIQRAAQLLEQFGVRISFDDPTRSPEACLEAADTLWRSLYRLRQDDEELWSTIGIDGLDGDEMLSRLNDVVYEILCATSARPATT